MGHFLAVSAFRDQSVDSVASATIAYAEKYGVECKTMEPGNASEKTDAMVFAPDIHWTVVVWPDYFNIHDFELCKSLSEQMPSLVSTVHVYDGDYWANAVFNNGAAISLFASIPQYFGESEDDATDLTAKWSGNAIAIANALSVPAESVSPYLVKLDAENNEKKRKAFPDDEFDLSDIWVFVDFWRRQGIHYPADMSSPQCQLRFERRFSKKLPTSEQFEL